MATDPQPPQIPGGNLTLWIEFLGPAVAWACGFELSYAVVPWCCAHEHPHLVQVAWLPFLLISIALGLLARAHRQRLSEMGARQPAQPRSRFMATIGMMSSGLFSLTILVQAAATYIFHPCQR